MRAAIYCRVSDATQERRGTIEAQRRTLTAYARSAGFEVVGTYEDDGRSGKAGTLHAREAFHRLAADIEPKRIAVVLVVDEDRLTRSEDMIERYAVIGTLQRAGVKVATPGGALDLGTFAGDLLIGIKAAVAAEERKKILARTAAGRQSALLRGSKPSGPTPYGLRWSKQAGWSVDEAEAAIIREIHERVAAGESCRSIAVDFERRKVPRQRAPWSQFNVWHLVRYSRTRYAGSWTADKHRKLTVPVPRILTDKQIEAAEFALVDNKRRGLEWRTRGVYLFDRGRLVCARCGGVVGVQSAKADGGPATYVCRRRSSVPAGTPGRCDLPIFRVEDVDAAAWAEVSRWLAQPDLVAQATRRPARRRGPGDLEAARAELTRLDQVGAVLVDRGAAALPADVLSARLDRLAQERRSALEVLRQAEAAERARTGSTGPAVDVGAELERLRVACERADVRRRRQIVRDLVGTSKLNGRGLVLDVHLPRVLDCAAAYSSQHRNPIARLPVRVSPRAVA